MVEIYFNVQSDNGSLTDQHALRRWSIQYMRALEDRKDLRVVSRLRNHFQSSGLVEVDSKMIPLPLSAWSTGQLSLLALTKRFKSDGIQIRECEPSGSQTVTTSMNSFDP